MFSVQSFSVANTSKTRFTIEIIQNGLSRFQIGYESIFGLRGYISGCRLWSKLFVNTVFELAVVYTESWSWNKTFLYYYCLCIYVYFHWPL